MKSLKIILPVICIAMIMTSCSKTAKQGKLIPKDAAIVIVVNSSSISSKLPWEEITQSSWFKEHTKDSGISEQRRQLMEHPELSGIDAKSDLVFYVLKYGDDGQVVLSGSIKDEKQFEAFTKHFDSTAVPVKDGNLNVLKIKNKTVLTWDDSKFVFVSNAPMKPTGMNWTDSTQQTTAMPGNDNLVPISKRLINLNSDSSLYKDEKFVTMINEDGDIHFMVNIQQLTKGTSMGYLNMLKLDKFFDNNVTTATLNFENGKIAVTQKSYMSKELSDIFKKYSGGTVSNDMLKNLPSNNLAMAFAMHYDPQALLELIKLAGVDGLINMAMAQSGVTLDDFVKANKGDLVFALSDVKLKADTSAHSDDTSFAHHNKPDMSVVFAVAIGDKDAFGKLMNAAKKMTENMPSKSMAFKNTGQYLVIGNSQQAVDNFTAGNKSAPAFMEKVKDYPVFGYADIQMFMKAFQPAARDSIQKKILDINLAMWDNGLIYGGNYSNGAVTTNYEINLVDKNTNSLKQLNKYLDQMIVYVKHKNKDLEGLMSDSSAVKVDSAVHH